MVPECIDRKVGSFFRVMMKKSVPENVADCSNEYNFGELWEARLRWSGCPACRPEFAVVPAVFKQIGVGLESRCRDGLSGFHDDFLAKKCSLLAAVSDLPSAHPESSWNWPCESRMWQFYLSWAGSTEPYPVSTPINQRRQ
jgi:hypothetical protein